METDSCRLVSEPRHWHFHFRQANATGSASTQSSDFHSDPTGNSGTFAEERKSNLFNSVTWNVEEWKPSLQSHRGRWIRPCWERLNRRPRLPVSLQERMSWDLHNSTEQSNTWLIKPSIHKSVRGSSISLHYFLLSWSFTRVQTRFSSLLVQDIVLC